MCTYNICILKIGFLKVTINLRDVEISTVALIQGHHPWELSFLLKARPGQRRYISQHPDVIETPPRGQVSAELFRRKNLAGEVLIKPDKIWWKTWHSFGLKVGNEFIARLQVAMPTPHCFKKNTCLAWRRAPLGAEFWLLSHSKACHFDSLQSLQAICTCSVFPLDEWGRTGPSERHKQNHPGGWVHSNRKASGSNKWNIPQVLIYLVI